MSKNLIGFDISHAGKKKSGCGNYTLFLINLIYKYLSSEYDFKLFPHFGTDYYDPDYPTKPLLHSDPLINKLEYFKFFTNRKECVDFWKSDNLSDYITNFDFIFSNNFWCPNKTINSKLIYTLYDLSFIENPNWTTEHNRNICFNSVFNASIYADHIIAISEHTKNHFLRVFPNYDENMISVIYPKTKFDLYDINALKPNINLQKNKFWLSCGTIEPRKNHLFLIDAYKLYLSKSKNKFPLIFAGSPGWIINDINQIIIDKGLKDYIKFLNYPSDSEIKWLYENCIGNLYPSKFEGFGLPVLEGYQLNAPTITSNLSSTFEIANGEFCYDLEVNLWLEALLNIEKDASYRKKLIEHGAKRKNFFSKKMVLAVLKKFLIFKL